jgi:hypothetical protein
MAKKQIDKIAGLRKERIKLLVSRQNPKKIRRNSEKIGLF